MNLENTINCKNKFGYLHLGEKENKPVLGHCCNSTQIADNGGSASMESDRQWAPKPWGDKTLFGQGESPLARISSHLLIFNVKT